MAEVSSIDNKTVKSGHNYYSEALLHVELCYKSVAHDQVFLQINEIRECCTFIENLNVSIPLAAL